MNNKELKQLKEINKKKNIFKKSSLDMKRYLILEELNKMKEDQNIIDNIDFKNNI